MQLHVFSNVTSLFVKTSLASNQNYLYHLQCDPGAIMRSASASIGC